jgi:hypothetical protein
LQRWTGGLGVSSAELPSAVVVMGKETFWYDKWGVLKHDSLRIGKLTIHLCTPWEVKGLDREWAPPWRLHINWGRKGEKGWHLAIPLSYPDIYGNPDPNHKHTWFAFTRRDS